MGKDPAFNPDLIPDYVKGNVICMTARKVYQWKGKRLREEKEAAERAAKEKEEEKNDVQ